MGSFEELKAKLDAFAKEARRILKAKEVTEKLAVPGIAYWNGYNSDNKPTVKKNGQVFVVKALSSLSLRIGDEVYVDENYTIQYKTKKEEKKPKKDPAKEISYDRRPFKRRRSTPIGPRIIKRVKGSTWLVYHDYLKELNWTTEAEIGTNPELVGWSLFFSLAPLAVLGGGVLLGIIYWTLFDPKVEPVNPIKISAIPTPENHPDISANTNLNADEYNFFIILQGLVDQFAQTYPFLQTDGFWLGVNQAIGNYIFFIGRDTYSTIDTWTPNTGCAGLPSGITFSEKYILRPWRYSATDQLVGLLYHFGPFKAQACLYRMVGVYPPKHFKINFHAWEVPDRDLPALDEGAENYFELVRELLPMKHKQFVIPDDIVEWNQITGNGTLNPDGDKADIFPYEIVPAHDYATYVDEDDPYDLTKFAAYSENNLFLNYVIKAHAPWTGLDDTLRVNYYALNLRATNPSDGEELQISYSLKPITFDIPQEFRFEGNIYVEDPQFPLQAGDRSIATRQITYTIKGTDDPTQSTGIYTISAHRGDREKTGILPGLDPDCIPVRRNQETGILSYFPGSSVTFSVENPPEGFVYNEFTGEYVFDQNISAYAQYGIGQGVNFEFNYIVKDPAGGESYGAIAIYLTGSTSTFVSPGPQVPEAIPDSLANSTDAPPPSNEWDPEPILESEETGEVQNFDKIRTLIPLPENDEKGCPWGYSSRVARIEIKDVEAPIIKLKVGNTYYDDPGGFSPDDFIFSVTTDGGRINKAANFVTDFTVKSGNYDRLAANQELSITYTIKGMLNTSPFVGNWENLTESQKRKVRSDFIKFAFAGDWRGRISNEREENTANNINSKVLEDSVTRDTPQIPVINIDIPNRDITANWIREFYWYSDDAEKADPKMAIAFQNENQETVTYDDESIKILNLNYEFDQSYKELLFYTVDDTNKLEPIDDESLLDIINNSAEVEIWKKWVWDALPSGTDRNDDSGLKWRVDRERTKPLKGYLIFGWSD